MGRRCDKLGTLPTMLTDTNWRTRRAKQVWIKPNNLAFAENTPIDYPAIVCVYTGEF